MRHGMLAFGRSKTKWVTVEGPGTSMVVVPELQGDEARARLQDEIDAEHGAMVARVREQRAEWISKYTVRSRVAEEVKVGVFKSETRTFDEITIDGTTERLDAGSAEAVLAERATKRFPIEDCGKAVVHRPHEVRSWRATFYESGQTTPIETPPNLNIDYGLPTGWVLGELDRLAGDGWKLVNVSEDHGLYQGEDAFDEAYLTRIRYLLAR